MTGVWTPSARASLRHAWHCADPSMANRKGKTTEMFHHFTKFCQSFIRNLSDLCRFIRHQLNLSVKFITIWSDCYFDTEIISIKSPGPAELQMPDLRRKLPKPRTSIWRFPEIGVPHRTHLWMDFPWNLPSIEMGTPKSTHLWNSPYISRLL